MSIQKITDQEVRALWVQRLSDTPNRAGRYGTPGLTAAEVKAAYDALSLRIVEAYNTLVDAIESGRLTESIRVLGEKTLHEVLSDIKSGSLATYLSVDGLRTLSSLAAEFDTHDHPAYAPLAGNEEQPFSVGEPTDGADALPLDFADGRYLSSLCAEYDRASGRLRLSADRLGAPPASAEIHLPTEEELLEKCNKRLERLGASLINLRESALGVTFESVNVADVGCEHGFEEGTLPTAQLKRLGGYTSFLSSGGFWNKAPTGFTVSDAEGNITENAESALEPLKRLFPDFVYGISPSLCNYYDFESGLYHRCVKAESYPTPLLGSGTTFSSPQLVKETSSAYIFNVQLLGKKPSQFNLNICSLFCSSYFRAVSASELNASMEKSPLIALYGESNGYRCLKIRIPKENDWGITADPKTLTSFFVGKAIMLIMPYEEEILSVREALLAEGSEETLPDGLIEVCPGGKISFGSHGYTVCYELEYDKKTKGEDV